MVDPSSLIVTALAVGAAAGLKPTATQAIKDAYAGLKALLKSKYERVSVEELENDPANPVRQQAIQDGLMSVGAAADEDVVRQAQALLDAVRDLDPGAATAVGVTIDHLEAASLRLADIVSTGSATGVAIGTAKVRDAVKIEGIRVESKKGSDGRP